MTNRTQTSGLELKLARVAAGVLLKDIADQMGVSSTRLSRVERESAVTPDMLRRYQAALATFRTSEAA